MQFVENLVFVEFPRVLLFIYLLIYLLIYCFKSGAHKYFEFCVDVFISTIFEEINQHITFVDCRRTKIKCHLYIVIKR